MPPPRSTVKKKPQTLTKEAAPRPTKKLAKENSDEVPSLEGLSRSITSSARKPVSSRGTSSSPHSASPVHFDGGNLSDKSAKKLDSSGSIIRSRLAAPGTLTRRLRETARAEPSDHGSSRTIGHQPGRNTVSTSMPARPKYPVQMSKSGVDSNTKMDGHPPEKAPSTPGTDACKIIGEGDVPVENVPPISSDSQLFLQIQSLEERMRLISDELTMTIREKEAVQQRLENLTEEHNATLQELQATHSKQEVLLAENQQLTQSHNSSSGQLESLKMQVDDLRTQCDGLYTEQKRVCDANAALQVERDQQSEQLRGMMDEREQTLSELADFRAQAAAALEKAQNAEDRLTKVLDEREAIKKDFSAVKKKRHVDLEKAQEEVILLQKKIEEKINEAESWRAVAELKGEEIRKLQKELEDARSIVERHQLCEAELKRQSIDITSLQVKADKCTAVERDLRTLLAEKEDELRNLRRQSMLLTQEKDTLKYRLDEMSEQEPRRPRHSTVLVAGSLNEQLECLEEGEDL
ncbi:myosin heavy chain, striated muscle-like isoform X2 [Paramacrobiotus metropolitanus]|nr:myosin heavy chain, striated muscle-like isoform X2 [Paramacrobiotus metropolitanus]